MTDSPEPPADSSDGFDPVVVQVGTRALYLGDRTAADPACHDHTFEAVISLTLHSWPLTTHHHPLHDGPATEFEEFAAAVDATRDVLGDSRDDAVLVHCAAGISRSSTVITTAVAAEEQRTFDDVLAELEQHRKRARPHPALRALAREYLGEEPTSTEADARDRDDLTGDTEPTTDTEHHLGGVAGRSRVSRCSPSRKPRRGSPSIHPLRRAAGRRGRRPPE